MLKKNLAKSENNRRRRRHQRNNSGPINLKALQEGAPRLHFDKILPALKRLREEHAPGRPKERPSFETGSLLTLRRERKNFNLDNTLNKETEFIIALIPYFSAEEFNKKGFDLIQDNIPAFIKKAFENETEFSKYIQWRSELQGRKREAELEKYERDNQRDEELPPYVTPPNPFENTSC